MMTTNALSIVFLNAAVSWLLTTNTIEHWPQKQVFPNYDNKYYLLNNGVNADWTMPTARWVSNPNADTMSIETTVTRQRLLSFEFEKRKFSEVLTNEPWMHYSVEMQRVRTNVWIDPIPGDKPGFYVVPQSLSMRTRGMDLNPQFLIETNYFIPIKTNSLPLFTMENQPWMHGYTSTNGIGTNMFYILNNVATNYTVLWAATNATNTIK